MTGKYWDRAWSLVDGCTPCSPGCEHCWSAAMTHRFKKYTDDYGNNFLTNKSGCFNGKIITRPDRLDIPLKTRKATVFSVWNDLFHEDVPDGFITQVFAVARQSAQHTFLLLTKRALRMRNYIWSMQGGVDNHMTERHDNVWLGVTVCNQDEADEKIPLLLQTPAAHRGISIEPMLEEISVEWALGKIPSTRLPSIDAVILGGETGPGARPMHPDWVRSVRAQCTAAGVPFFFKQWGSLPTFTDCIGDKRPGPLEAILMPIKRLLDGKEHNELPWRK